MRIERDGDQVLLYIGDQQYTVEYNPDFAEGIEQIPVEFVQEMVSAQFRGLEDFAEVNDATVIVLRNALADGVDFDYFLRYYTVFLSNYYHQAMFSYAFPENTNRTGENTIVVFGEAPVLAEPDQPVSSHIAFDDSGFAEYLAQEADRRYLTVVNKIVKKYVDLLGIGPNYRHAAQGSSIIAMLKKDIKALITEALELRPAGEFGHAMRAVMLSFANRTSKDQRAFYQHLAKVSFEMKRMLMKEVVVPFYYPSLHLFAQRSEQNYIGETVKYYQELRLANEQLERQRLIKDKMIKQYSNTWANLLFPNWVLEIIKRIAELNAAKQPPFHKRQALQILLRVYRSEQKLKEVCKMLEMTHAGNANEFQAYIQEGLREGGSTMGIAIDEVIARSLGQVLNWIFADQHNQRIARIRHELTTAGYDLDLLSASFYETLLSNESQLTAWFNQHLYCFEVENRGGPWAEFTTAEDSGISAFFNGLFSELILNALTHGNKHKHSWLKLILDSKVHYGVTYARITVQNDTAKVIGSHQGGLRGWNEKLGLFNYTAGEELPVYIVNKVNNSQHVVRAVLRSDKLGAGK